MNHETRSYFSTGRAALLLTLLLAIAGLPAMAAAQINGNHAASGNNDGGSWTNAHTEGTITNQMPIADAGPDQTATLNDSFVQLDGSGSFDPDGHEPLTYDWTQTTGPAVVLSDSGAIAPSFTAPSMTTTLTFTLVVTDSLGLSSLPDETVITVVDIPIGGLMATNDGPTVVGDTTEFIAFITSGTGVSYTWDFGDGNSGNGPLADNDYTAAGDYTAMVTATNTAGSWTATTLVTITDVPVAGLVAANDSPTVAGQPTEFTATVSDGTGVVYTWDFGDGIGSGSGATPSYVYGAAGDYTATVTASNGANSLVDTTTVTVTNTAPVADAGPDQSVDGGELVTLDGSGSTDPDGHEPLTYQWSQIAGETVTLSDATQVNPTFAAPFDETPLVFELSVTDSFGLASEFADSVTISVTLPEFDVTTSVGNGQGSITPDTQNVTWGEEASFTVTPEEGWSITTVTGDTCNPMQDDEATWVASNITGDCAVEATFVVNQYAIGGQVSGLEGMGLTLDLNGIETLAITDNGPFTFINELDHDSNYTVTISAQPTNPSQTCQLANASGTINAADVTSVAVTCATPALVLDLDVIAFGNLDAETEAGGEVTLTNHGGAPVTISEITDPGEPFAVTGGSCLPVPTTLEPGEDCTIEVTYAPGSETAQHESSFEIISDAPSSPDPVQLSGHSFSVIAVPINRSATLVLLALVLLMGGWWQTSRRSCRLRPSGNS